MKHPPRVLADCRAKRQSSRNLVVVSFASAGDFKRTISVVIDSGADLPMLRSCGWNGDHSMFGPKCGLTPSGDPVAAITRIAPPTLPVALIPAANGW